ncbi:hypothetical protein BWI96_07205 [Siphonobacter sp. SORGH_AS_0500]|nr:hypothetical protein BWI96_07205 [Siphonobacter sp. SORGH_AS_0500]
MKAKRLITSLWILLSGIVLLIAVYMLFNTYVSIKYEVEENFSTNVNNDILLKKEFYNELVLILKFFIGYIVTNLFVFWIVSLIKD